MQIRRFFAKDMRNALAEVSRELGPDAAILSSRRIGGGVELLAAIDYDPSVLTTVAPRSVETESASVERVPVSEPKRFNPPKESAQPASKKTPFEAFLELSESQNAAELADAYSSAPSAQRTTRNGSDRNRTERARNDSRMFERPQAEAAKPSLDKRPARFEPRGESTPAIAAANLPTTPASMYTEEFPNLQTERSRDSAASGGLRDLQEEVRQLRGLMQEQLQGLAWRELKQRQPLRAMLTKRLAALELSPRMREHYAGAEGRDVEQALASAYANIARDIVNSDDAMLDRGGIYAFVGATGVGKTTTIAKLAARFALQHGAGSVALISTDSFRIAGHDQLATYARLIGCAIRIADSAASLQQALDSFVDRRLILIDTAGMSQRDARLAEQLAALASARYPVKQVLVLSATAQRAILQESVKQFGQRRVHGAILTKLDETTSLGAVLTVLLESRLPLMASCDGQRVPEDLRSLRGAQLVDRALKLAEQFRDGPDEWLVAQELPVNRGAAKPGKVTAHAGI